MSAAPEEVDWARLDKKKFLVVGAGLFSGVTTALYPLSVVKTQQMALANAPRGLRGAKETAQTILRVDGVRGLYRGFGTTIFGLVPARGVYLTTLERVKATTRKACEQRGMGQAETAAIASSVGGGVASLTTQAVIVPVDVVTQRLMVAGSRGSSRGQSGRLDPDAVSTRGQRLNGIQMAQKIVRQEGLIGLYRGFGASILTFVPSSAVWWGAYGGYQKLIWQQLDRWGVTGGRRGSTSSSSSSNGSSNSSGSSSVIEIAPARPTHHLVGVQTASAACAGLTSALLTNPLDVVKTRLQVTESERGSKRPTFAGTLQELLKSDGVKGLWRGVGPRILSSLMWGGCMVNAYELLKRICAKPLEAVEAEAADGL